MWRRDGVAKGDQVFEEAVVWPSPVWKREDLKIDLEISRLSIVTESIIKVFIQDSQSL